MLLGRAGAHLSDVLTQDLDMYRVSIESEDVNPKPRSSNNSTIRNKVLSEYYLCGSSSGGHTAHRNMENRPYLHFSLNHF